MQNHVSIEILLVLSILRTIQPYSEKRSKGLMSVLTNSNQTCQWKKTGLPPYIPLKIFTKFGYSESC